MASEMFLCSSICLVTAHCVIIHSKRRPTKQTGQTIIDDEAAQ